MELLCGLEQASRIPAIDKRTDENNEFSEDSLENRAAPAVMASGMSLVLVVLSPLLLLQLLLLLLPYFAFRKCAAALCNSCRGSANRRRAASSSAL